MFKMLPVWMRASFSFSRISVLMGATVVTMPYDARERWWACEIGRQHIVMWMDNRTGYWWVQTLDGHGDQTREGVAVYSREAALAEVAKRITEICP
jgi:hypothetical protein